MILRIKVLALLYALFVLGGSPNAVAQNTSIASNNQVLFGGQYYDSAGNVQTGTMSNQGNWNMNTTAFPGAGYYSGLTSTITSANVCSGTAVFGAAGAAACEGGTTSSPAGTANILSGEQAWDATGTELTGTMVNQGALNAADSFPGAGYYNGTVTNAPSASQIISGSTILGVAGTSTGSFSLNTASNANRDAGVAVVPQLAGQTTSTQFNLNSEITTYYQEHDIVHIFRQRISRAGLESIDVRDPDAFVVLGDIQVSFA